MSFWSLNITTTFLNFDFDTDEAIEKLITDKKQIKYKHGIFTAK